MPKSIAILGTGPGLGQAVARRYAQEGYDLVLVARRARPLDEFAAQLSDFHVSVSTIAADLSQEGSSAQVIDEIRAAVGCPTVLYYASNPGTPNAGFQPATTLRAGPVRAYMQHALYALIDLVQEFLPEMTERGEGQILVAQGTAALQGLPNMSGPGLALAAQRNYLQSLEAETDSRGIFIGRLYIGAAITGTPFHTAMLAAASDSTAAPEFPIVTPRRLADQLWDMTISNTHEITYPDNRTSPETKSPEAATATEVAPPC
ncbi:SDR family NAD(P)-dependent oxidoreductase [Planctomonas sp. JC2975]|uniref:SDR family NAD(P)-dependent oxidoreductase n=1 Tax=Planctomonas sp. JC2975 TaxID=2729626 RepID=UPI0014757CF5|nr:SDR family NAD(P)-dependent oxidoreductase [Planctomonas sp. JC2975]NNC12865.1 SDR family NAD(P)-dependent oxidoreductase [Planctomonas sp. JC2975]